MNLNTLLDTLERDPSSISFDEAITVIDETYLFSITQFQNGPMINAAGKNNGSCKIFAFGLLNNLTEHQTLHCFGDYYREDVLQHPNNDDHQNIRNFIKTGWTGIVFSGDALELKEQ